MTVLTPELPTLSVSNRAVNQALLGAMAALHRLNELGLTVRYVEVTATHHARLVLLEAPANGALEHALKTRIALGDGVLETRVATLLGCQVEWAARRRPATDAVTAEVAA